MEIKVNQITPTYLSVSLRCKNESNVKRRRNGVFSFELGIHPSQVIFYTHMVGMGWTQPPIFPWAIYYTMDIVMMVARPLLYRCSLFWKDGVPRSSDGSTVNPYARVQMAGDNIGPINLHTFAQAHAQHTLSFLVSCNFVIKIMCHEYSWVLQSGLIME
jgi:hypothetical protein